MATWAELQTMTTFDQRSVATDGTDIFFAQFGGGVKYHVFKYDPVGDSISQISNDASFSGTTPLLASNIGGGLPGTSLQCFGGNLYALVYTADGSNNLHVYSYDGAGTAWTKVFEVTKAMKCVLYSTASHLIVAMAYPTDFVFDWAYYSADGSSWSAATVDNVPAPIGGTGGTIQIFAFAYGQGISPVIVDQSSHSAALADPDNRYRWFEWSPTSFDITQSADYLGDSGVWTPTDVWLHTVANYRRDLFHWYQDSGVWKYVSTLGDVWAAPANHTQGGNEAAPLYTVGFTNQPGVCNSNFILMTDGEWSNQETVGSATLSHAVLINTGYGFLFSQTKIYGRDEPFPVGPADQYGYTHSPGGIPGAILVIT